MDNYCLEVQIPINNMEGYFVVATLNDNQNTIKRFIDSSNNLIIPCPTMMDQAKEQIRSLRFQTENEEQLKLQST